MAVVQIRAAISTAESKLLLLLGHESRGAEIKVHRCLTQINGVPTALQLTSSNATQSPNVPQFHHLVVQSGGRELVVNLIMR